MTWASLILDEFFHVFTVACGAVAWRGSLDSHLKVNIMFPTEATFSSSDLLLCRASSFVMVSQCLSLSVNSPVQKPLAPSSVISHIQAATSSCIFIKASFLIEPLFSHNEQSTFGPIT